MFVVWLILEFKTYNVRNCIKFRLKFGEYNGKNFNDFCSDFHYHGGL